MPHTTAFWSSSSSSDSCDGQGALQCGDGGPAHERHARSDGDQDMKRQQQQQARVSFASSVCTNREAARHGRADALNQLVVNTATRMRDEVNHENELCEATGAAVSRSAPAANPRDRPGLVLSMPARRRPGLVVTVPARDGSMHRPTSLEQPYSSLLHAAFDHGTLPPALIDGHVAPAALQVSSLLFVHSNATEFCALPVPVVLGFARVYHSQELAYRTDS